MTPRLKGCLRGLVTAYVVMGIHGSAFAAPPEPQDEKPGDPVIAPEQKEEARTRFARGTQLYDEGEFKLALIEFERAYSIAPNYRILYNIGQVQQQLGQYAKALTTLERYLEVGGEKVPADRAAAVGRDISTLRARTAKVTVRVTEPGAEITLDGALLGTSPLPPGRLIDAGEHRLSVSKPGFRTETRSLVLAGGDSATSEFTLRKEQGAAVVAARPSPSNTPAWVAWGATGAFAIGAGVTGALALGASSDLESERNRLGSTQDSRAEIESRSRTFAIVTDTLAVTAIVAAGVAVYLTLTAKKTAEPSLSGLAGSMRF